MLLYSGKQLTAKNHLSYVLESWMSFLSMDRSQMTRPDTLQIPALLPPKRLGEMLVPTDQLEQNAP